MLNLLTKTIETVSRSISYAVDVEFEKDGVKHEAHVICILNEETNIGFHDWDCFIENEDDFHELTLDEENQILEHAKKYAQTLAG